MLFIVAVKTQIIPTKTIYNDGTVVRTVIIITLPETYFELITSRYNNDIIFSVVGILHIMQVHGYYNNVRITYFNVQMLR